MAAAPIPVLADPIALINANATPLPGFARDGVTAVAYGRVQYNGGYTGSRCAASRVVGYSSEGS
ncbi:MAG: hypothetical protein LBD34_00890 [Puniceicoccales bacterium]|jgi:hypothetical protein|nr:hypothetical protein [Puniceicoccales bacterium]